MRPAERLISGRPRGQQAPPEIGNFVHEQLVIHWRAPKPNWRASERANKSGEQTAQRPTKVSLEAAVNYKRKFGRLFLSAGPSLPLGGVSAREAAHKLCPFRSKAEGLLALASALVGGLARSSFAKLESPKERSWPPWPLLALHSAQWVSLNWAPKEAAGVSR